MLDQRRILVVDDDVSVAAFLAESLRAEGYEVHVANEGGQALTMAHDLAQRDQLLDVILLDLALPGWRPALPLIPHFRESHPFVEIVVITGGYETKRSEILYEAFTEYGVCDFLEKPIEDLELKIAIKRAHQRSAARLRVAESHRELVARNQEQMLELAKRETKIRDIRAGELRAKLRRIESERVWEHVLDVGLKLLSAMDTDQLLEIAIDAIQAVVPTTATVVFLRKSFDDHALIGATPEDYLSCLAYRAHVQQRTLPEDMFERFGLRIADEVVSTCRSVRLPGRVPVGSRREEEVSEVSRAVHSLICVPLVDAGRRVLGAVLLFNRRTDRGRISSRGFTDSDVRVLGRISAFLACGVVREHELGSDPLTQIANRRVLRRRVQEEVEALSKQDRVEDLTTWFGMLDVDYFRVYNKISGHLTGDRVLRMVARAIEDALRDHDFVARFGGEEFCLVLKRVADEAAARKVLNRVRKAIAALPVPNRENMPFGSITASIGGTRLCPDDTFDVVFERADRALKPLKQSRETRNAVAIEPSPCD